MRALMLIAALLVSACVSATNGVIVMGDSLSHFWPYEMDVDRVQVMVQTGRTIRDFEPPRDMIANLGADTVVYMLGGNDSTQTVLLRTELAMKRHIRFLEDAGFRVLVIIVPWEKPIRTLQIDLCLENNWECHDMQEVYDLSRCPDGIHPDWSLIYDIADWVESKL